MRFLPPLALTSLAVGQLLPNEFNFNHQLSASGFNGVSHTAHRSVDTKKDAFLDSLVANLTVPELGKSVHIATKWRFFAALQFYYSFFKMTTRDKRIYLSLSLEMIGCKVFPK